MKYFGGEAVVALVCVGTPAFAQQAPTKFATPTEIVADAQSERSEPSAADDKVIGDIIVTAQRREESLQKSSLSIQVLSADSLRLVSRPQDLTSLTPGLQIGTAGPNQQVYIRGVGDNAASSRTQSGVLFTLDDVPLARSTATTTAFYDLARVEVLKGPQGTLYGRNSSGGVINVISNKPRLGEFSGNAGAELGNYDLVNVDAAINLPIGTNLAIRAAGQIVRRDGYLSDGGQDQHTEAGRVRLYWEPSKSFSLLLNVDASHIGGQGSGVVVLPLEGRDPWRSNTQQPLVFPFQFGPATAPFTKPNDRQVDSNIFGVSATIAADLGFATLTVIPAYRKQDQGYVTYTTNFRFAEQLDGEQKSLEARLSNSSSLLNWTVGSFLYRQNDKIISYNSQGTLSANLVHDNRKSLGVFGQASVAVLPKTRVIAGLRYTHETGAGDYQFGIGGYPVVPFTPNGPVIEVPALANNKFTYKAGLEHDLSSTSMVFATTATGFKAGGFDNTPGSPTCSGVENYKPERLTSYQVGSRNRLAGGTLQLNLEGFYWRYKDQQITGLAPNQCGIVGFYTRNAGTSTIKGLNADIVWRATRRDTFGFAVEYADGKYDDFRFSQIGLGAYAPAAQSRCSAASAGGGLFAINCSGLTIPRLPKWTGQMNYAHEFYLGSSGSITASTRAQAASKRWLDIGYGPNGLAKSYLIAGADLTYTTENGRFSVSAFVNNIFNDAQYTSGQNVATNTPAGTRYEIANIGAPRTVGGRARIRF